MRRNTIVALLSALVVFFEVHAQESTIIINSGSTLLISGGEHSFDCNDIVVKNGGSLEITGGKISDLEYRVESGGSFSRTGGEVLDCGSFFIIPTPQGNAIINL